MIHLALNDPVHTFLISILILHSDIHFCAFGESQKGAKSSLSVSPMANNAASGAIARFTLAFHMGGSAVVVLIVIASANYETRIGPRILICRSGAGRENSHLSRRSTLRYLTSEAIATWTAATARA